MAITNTYVTSVNGKTGDLPYELDYVQDPEGNGDYDPVFGQVTHKHRNLWLDAGDFKVDGTGGDTISKRLQDVSQTIEPLEVERIGTSEDYTLEICGNFMHWNDTNLAWDDGNFNWYNTVK